MYLGLNSIWCNALTKYFCKCKACMPFFNLTQGMFKLVFVFFKNGPTQASFVYLWWFQLILVFSSKQHNFYSKSMCINVHSVYVTGIRTHCLSIMSSLRPGRIKSLMLIAPHVFRSFDPTENIFRFRPGPCLRTSKERLLQDRMRSQPIR